MESLWWECSGCGGRGGGGGGSVVVVEAALGCEVCAQVPGLARYAIELRGPNRSKRVIKLYWYSRWVDFPSSASIGSKPFFANAWSVLHMALHVLPRLRRWKVAPALPDGSAP